MFSRYSWVRQDLRLLYGFVRRVPHSRTWLSIYFAVLLLAVVVEGVSLAMVVPIISSGNEASFQGVPILGSVSSFFSQFEFEQRMRFVALGLLCLILLRAGSEYASAILGFFVPMRMRSHLVRAAFRDLMCAEMTTYWSVDLGNIQNFLVESSHRIVGLVTTLLGIVLNLAIFLLYFALMTVLSPIATLLAFTFLVAIALAMRRIGHIQLENSRRFTIAMSELSQVIYESLRGMKHIRLSNSEKTAYRNFSSKFDNLLSTQLKLTAINALSNPVFLASGGVLIAVLIYAGSTWFSGEAESWTSDLLLFLLVLYRMMGPASSLSAGRLSYLSLRDALDHFTRHERLFRENEQSIGTQTISNLSSGIEFDSVSFSYSTEEGGVLHDISVKIPANKMTAIVGPSGAGKSTIVGLIARLFDPTSGRVTVEGIDLRDVDLHSWRSMMAIVSQDTFLYNDTVANNLRFACPGASDAQLQDACRLAAADEFIMAFPNGYDTKIGESGVRLSGGQQQRLSIARAFLRNPVLLILDEATSSLDSRTETAIQRAMEHWSSRSTMVVIAHRLSTIQRADQILVLDEGRLVERGTHQELIELGGDYWDMVSHQRLDLVDAFVQAPMPNRKEE